MGPLITPEVLDSLQGDVHLFDVRWALADPSSGRAAYEAGHIPGAVFVDLDADLAGPPGRQGRHPLPSETTWAATLGRLGVDPAGLVVVYDDSGGAVAARMWWMLRSVGHAAAQVLDGGYQAWVSDGREVEAGPGGPPRPTVYPVPAGFAGVVTRDQLGGRSLLDVRAAARYRGDEEPVDPRAGHIPGAVNMPISESLDETGRFLDPDALRRRFADLPESPVVSCGSGVNACHTALAMILVGRPMPDIYIGSFSEWSRCDLPVVSGDSP